MAPTATSTRLMKPRNRRQRSKVRWRQRLERGIKEFGVCTGKGKQSRVIPRRKKAQSYGVRSPFTRKSISQARQSQTTFGLNFRDLRILFEPPPPATEYIAIARNPHDTKFASSVTRATIHPVPCEIAALYHTTLPSVGHRRSQAAYTGSSSVGFGISENAQTANEYACSSIDFPTGAEGTRSNQAAGNDLPMQQAVLGTQPLVKKCYRPQRCYSDSGMKFITMDFKHPFSNAVSSGVTEKRFTCDTSRVCFTNTCICLSCTEDSMGQRCPASDQLTMPVDDSKPPKFLILTTRNNPDKVHSTSVWPSRIRYVRGGCDISNHEVDSRSRSSTENSFDFRFQIETARRSSTISTPSSILGDAEAYGSDGEGKMHLVKSDQIAQVQSHSAHLESYNSPNKPSDHHVHASHASSLAMLALSSCCRHRQLSLGSSNANENPLGQTSDIGKGNDDFIKLHVAVYQETTVQSLSAEDNHVELKRDDRESVQEDWQDDDWETDFEVADAPANKARYSFW